MLADRHGRTDGRPGADSGRTGRNAPDGAQGDRRSMPGGGLSTIEDIFIPCANIITGFAVVFPEFGRNATPDLYSPNFRRWRFDHQINFCTRHCSVKIGF